MEDESEYTVLDVMFDIADVLDRKVPSLYEHQDECDACRIYDILIDCINLDIKMLCVAGHQWCCISHIDGEQVYCTCDSEFDSWADFVKHIEKVRNNAGECDIEQTEPYDYMMPVITACQNDAYVNGRTAEPSLERIRAVAEYLATMVTEPPVLDDYKSFIPMAKKILEVARNAVM